jgi:zinc transporter
MPLGGSAGSAWTGDQVMTADSSETVSGAPASGIIYVYRFLDDGTSISLPCEEAADALSAHDGWTWIHIGLADVRARTWISQHAPVSELAREVLVGTDEHVRLDIVGSEIMGVMPDLRQSFATPGEDIVRLRFTMTERVLITSRRTPVHSLELTRRSIENGRRFPTPIAFLDGIVDQFADAIGRLSETLADQLDQAENRLLDRNLDDEGQKLGRMRLQLAHIHRQLMQLRLLFQRIEPRIALENEKVARAIRALAQKLDAIDHDVAAQYERARLLLDEVASRMAAITNRRLFTLSILTACLLPPTLVTGVFGMNTKDLPFQNTDGGTWFALAIAAAAGATAYWLIARLRAL